MSEGRYERSIEKVGAEVRLEAGHIFRGPSTLPNQETEVNFKEAG